MAQLLIEEKINKKKEFYILIIYMCVCAVEIFDAQNAPEYIIP